MGNQKTITLKPENLKELAKETDFTENQIKDWYKSFLKNHPSGFCSKHEFKKTYADLFPEVAFLSFFVFPNSNIKIN